jgi:hypothetical protein
MPSKNNISQNKRYFQKQLDNWTNTITQNLTNLTEPQAVVLAMMSLGMIVAQSCALTAISVMLAISLKIKYCNVYQRIREWRYDAKDKKGTKKGLNRTQIDVSKCFDYLIKWIISLWQSDQLAIALDATTLGLSFTILVVSIVYRGCAIPVAWTILVPPSNGRTDTKGNEKKSWNKEWLHMLRLVRHNIPRHFIVIVMTDRGLYSPRLFKRIVRLKWHPFMRINANGTFCPKGNPEGNGSFKPIHSFAEQPTKSWQGSGVAFKTKGKRLSCTLLALWEEGQKEAWFIITDLPSSASSACWYGMRAWIEQSFRIAKRGGWQWHRTRMTDPERASRLLLAISVATLWLMSVGGELDAEIPDSTIPNIRCYLPQTRGKRKATLIRLVSIFRVGMLVIHSCLDDHKSLPFGRFFPEPWDDINPYKQRVSGANI